MADYITIGSTNLYVAGAWKLTDPTVFLGQGPFRGTDRIVPGAAGAVARPRVLGTYDVVTELMVFGKNDGAGTPFANERLGIKANVATLRTNLLTGTSATMTHTFSDASTRTGACIVNELRVVSGLEQHVAGLVVLAMDVTLLAGKLT
jgi:hypothetical protein